MQGLNKRFAMYAICKNATGGRDLHSVVQKSFLSLVGHDAKPKSGIYYESFCNIYSIIYFHKGSFCQLDFIPKATGSTFSYFFNKACRLSEKLFSESIILSIYLIIHKCR